MHRYLFLLFFCLLLATSNRAQNSYYRSGEQESKVFADYQIDHFALPYGRNGNNVNHIVQGPYGFLWFGSHGGLHRFDGKSFTTFRQIEGDTASLSFHYVESLYWDRFDKL
ncbi:MAG: two-component regulator propeller domain-containing protein, partial [Saprospiraceae bacterium]|nr:two-component regulator propeller domain-containing protein [Saprospiraceae bacterium]